MSKILLVEDSPLWQQALVNLITTIDHEVTVAGSVGEATTYLQTPDDTPFDLVLLDLMLNEWSSEIDGLQIIPVIQALKPQQVKVILLIDDAYEGVLEAARQILFEHKDNAFRLYNKNHFSNGDELIEIVQQILGVATTKSDWGEAVDISAFYGRDEELTQLGHWITEERARLVTVLGFGGMGKSCLARKLSERITEQFDYIFWRDLRNGPLPLDVVGECIKFISDQRQVDLPSEFNERVALLLKLLHQHRCLIVLDNLETVLKSGGYETAFAYREGYEGYSRLVTDTLRADHRSCLLITSREWPTDLQADPASPGKAMRVLPLAGLKPSEGRLILDDRNLFGTEQSWAELNQRYQGNPLALKLVGQMIQEMFQGDIEGFLENEVAAIGTIRDVVHQQFTRLSASEREIMFWLAIEREATSVEQLLEDLEPPRSLAELAGITIALHSRYIIERVGATQFILQPVILEYVTNHFIRLVCDEIASGDLRHFRKHPLLKAMSKDYVRESQVRFVLKPVADALQRDLGPISQRLDQRINELLAQLRAGPTAEGAPSAGYAPGNLLNLLLYLNVPLDAYNFSHLPIWQVALRGAEARGINLAYSDLGRSTFTETFGRIVSLAYDASGQLLAAGSINGDIRLWQVADGQPLRTFRAHTGAVWSVSMSPNGRLLASGSSDYTVRLWDVSSGQCIHVFKEHQNQVRGVTFSPDGRLLASASGDHTVRLWDVGSGTCLSILKGHLGWTVSVAFSPNGALLASGSEDTSIMLWDVSRGETIQTLRDHKSAVRALVFTPSGTMLASASDDRSVKLWEVGSDQPIATIGGHQGSISSIAMSPDGRYLATSGTDATVRLWDIAARQSVKTLQGHTDWTRAVAFSRANDIVASGGDDETVRFWDYRAGRLVKTLQGYTNIIYTVVFSHDGTLLASAGENHGVQIWEIEGGRFRGTLRGTTNRIQSLAFSPDNGTIASASENLSVQLWDLGTGQCERTLHGHQHQVWSVAYSFDGSLLVSGSSDQTVRVWDVASGRQLRELRGHKARIRAVTFSPDASLIASGGYDRVVQLWGRDHDTPLRTLKGHIDTVWSIVFTPDGNQVVSAGDDTTIRVWSAASGECLRVLEGHTAGVISVAVSADGNLLVSGDLEGTIRVWSLKTGACLHQIAGHTRAVRAVDLHPTGRILVSGSDDETIKLWDTVTGALLQALIPERPYDRMNITGATGLTLEQRATLKNLGAQDLAAP